MSEGRPNPIRPIPAAAVLLFGAMAGILLLSDRVPVLLGIATLAVRGLVLRLLVGAAAAVGSLLLEYLQVRWTATRSFETADVIANTWGVYLGLLAGLAFGAALDAWEARRRAV